MKRIDVDSTHLKSIGYENGVLEIEFLDGNIYQYYKVPVHLWTGLQRATSKGGYYNRYILKKGYGGTKITDCKLATSTREDKYWVINNDTATIVDARKFEEAAWGVAEVLASRNPGTRYHVVSALGTVSVPRPEVVRTNY